MNQEIETRLKLAQGYSVNLIGLRRKHQQLSRVQN
jgi:hypothetical protein